MVIGLTGGIGCGKTAAAAFFAEQGFVHVDADGSDEPGHETAVADYIFAHSRGP